MDYDINWKPHKNLQSGHKLKEGGARVCNDAILGNFYFKLWGSGFKKPSGLQYLDIFW